MTDKETVTADDVGEISATKFTDVKSPFKITSEPRVFSVRIDDTMAKEPWNNAANSLCQKFRGWLTEVKDAEQLTQTSEDDGSGSP